MLLKKQLPALGLLILTVLVPITASAEPVDTTGPRCTSCCRGGGGGIAPSLQWLDLSPVEMVAKNEADLGRYDFDFSDNVFQLIGGMGHGGNSCVAKMGGAGYFGFKKFISAPLTVTLRDSAMQPVLRSGDTVKVDSTAHLYTMLAWGGFSVEKSFEFRRVMVDLGGMFGGGALILGKEFVLQNGNSAFSSNPALDTANMESNWTAAPLLCFDVHTSVSYRIASFLVAGVEGNVLFMNSSLGFNGNTDSFLTVNPGVRVKLIFGNI